MSITNGILVRKRVRRRKRLGVGFLFFMLIALPLVTLGGALGVDFTRMLTASREVSNATEAAAVAGAQQFKQNSSQLQENAANSKAIYTINNVATAEDVNAIKSKVLSVKSRVQVNPEGSQQVVVTTKYRVEGLSMISLLGALLGKDSSSTETFTVTRTADVCIPGSGTNSYTPTGGNCRRPFAP